MIENGFPPGWDEERVRRLIERYESQTEDEAVAEDEATLEEATKTPRAGEGVTRRLDAVYGVAGLDSVDEDWLAAGLEALRRVEWPDY